MKYEFAARAVARQWAIADGIHAEKAQDRYVEENFSLAWLMVTNSLLKDLSHDR